MKYFQYLKRAYKRDEEELFIGVWSDRMRGSSEPSSASACCYLLAHTTISFPSICHKEGGEMGTKLNQWIG